MQRSSRMRSGWIKGSLLAFVVAAGLLYLGSIKREVRTHSERLQRANRNDSIREKGMLMRMGKMEDHIDRLRECQNVLPIHKCWIESPKVSRFNHIFKEDVALKKTS